MQDIDALLQKTREVHAKLTQANRELRRGWSVFDLPPHGQEHIADILPFTPKEGRDR